MIHFKQLYYFWNAARYGGISKAAAQLNLTPQTISGQINELEQRLNVELFTRRGRRLELTDAGKLAFSHADEIFQIGRELEALLRGHREDERLLLRVGISDVVPKSITYRLLAPAYRLPESVRLVCLENKLEELFGELIQHKIDLVIADRPLPPGLGVKGYSHLLGKSHIAFYANQQLHQKYHADFPASLDGAPMLLPSMQSALRPGLEQWLAQRSIFPQIAGEFDDSALMKAFGQEGAGIFPAPAAIATEIIRQHGVEVIGHARSLSVKYYVISLERTLHNPAVAAIEQSAGNIFSG